MKKALLYLKRFILLLVLTITVAVIRDLSLEGSGIGKYAPLLPPLIAIVLAYATREVVFSLFSGIWIGAFLLLSDTSLANLLYRLNTSFDQAVNNYLVNSITDVDHARIILFSLGIGGLVGLIAQSGGTGGMLRIISKIVKTRRSGQLAAWLSGMIIFFDDYASCLIAGNLMRPMTDKLKISREKLAFIIDSTAAPIAALAIISTWIGYEVGQISDALKVSGLDHNAYLLFLSSLPYSFYSIFAIFFVFLISWQQKDYGPMAEAEERTINTGKLLADGAQPLISDDELSSKVPPHKERWYNAVIPIALLIILTVGGLYYSGLDELAGKMENSQVALILAERGVSIDPQGIIKAPFREILGAADTFAVLVWSAFVTSLFTILFYLVQGLMDLKTSMNSWFTGLKSMTMAMIILVLAWALSEICAEMQTGALVSSLAENIMSPYFLPVSVFLLCALISFATGSSWTTMAIMIPLTIQVSVSLAGEGGEGIPAFDGNLYNFLAVTLAAVLSGSIFGDHCSPISDTTIISSTAAAADHIDHVRTQLPYSLTIGFTAMLFGYLPAAFGIHFSWLWILSLVVMYSIIKFAGRATNKDMISK